MKNFNQAATSQNELPEGAEFEAEQNLPETAPSPDKTAKIGRRIAEITARKQEQKSRRRERFAYLDYDSEEFTVHAERAIALKERAKEEVKLGLRDPLDKFVVDENDYKVLPKQLFKGEEMMPMDRIASLYLSAGINLLDKLETADHAIYLDKSARPLSGLMNKIARAEGEKPPRYSYLNIDRNDIFAVLGMEIRNGYIDKDDNFNTLATGVDFIEAFNAVEAGVQKEILAGIRAQYLPKGTEIDFNAPDYAEQIMATPTKLAGQNVKIVDETQFSGATLDAAVFLLKEALKEEGGFSPTVSGEYFFENDGAMVGITGNVRPKHGTVPVWYEKDQTFGRGVSDRSDSYHHQRFEQEPNSRNFARKIGSMVLSAPHYENGKYLRDDKFEELMLDFDQMILDYKAGKILYNPFERVSMADDASAKVQWRLEKAGFMPKIEDSEVYFPEFNRLNMVRKQQSRELAEFEKFKKPII